MNNIQAIEKAFKESKTFVNITCFKESGYFSKIYVIDNNQKMVINKIKRLLNDKGLFDITVYILNTKNNTGLLFGSKKTEYKDVIDIKKVESFLNNN